MKRKPISLIHLLALIFVTGINASEDLSPHSHIVQTQNGPIQGILKQARGGSNYVAYLGLRYVKPVKRFQKHLGQETSKLPVMVFIHGGGFIFGDGNNYGADYFMESEDVILVTFNYRLGLLGFLSTGDDAITSNLGLLDQIMALRFVKENIPAFNGDASKVTVFGNSAGSASIHFMLMSPLAEGLFNAAIMQSGALSFWSYSPNPRETTLRFVKEAARNCKNIKEDAEPEEQSIQIRKCLEKKKTKQLLLSQIVFWMRWPGFNILSRFLPTAEVASHSGATHDSYFASLPESWKQTGKQTVYHNKVPVMLGTTSDEGATLFAAPVYHSEEALKQLNDEWKQVAPIAFCYEGFFPDKKLPAISKKIKKFYFGTDPITLENKQALVNLYSDVLFLLPSLFAADEMARNGFTVYPYKFSYSGEWSLRQALFKDKEDMFQGKVGHADELQYLFPHPLLGPPLEPNSESEKFSKSLVKLWTSFAKQGKPEVNWNNGNTVEWKPIQTKNQAPLSFDLMNIDKEPSIVKLDINERAQFWGKLIKDYSKEKSKATNVPKTEL
ncbi:Esterase E4 [Orchesella cincta]|uniref:Esterase E4 n=1 Tax=Orchesella cincta TaxID=48709 RepID=A0A1D2MUG6_ORCCI|nr:Esterase E4 [Orchesella cincta]